MADQIRASSRRRHPETRDHLTKLLVFESDITVGSAASGREARDGRPTLPDVVLMDINMDMDGTLPPNNPLHGGPADFPPPGEADHLA